jgi:hypothetical protein
MRIEIPTLPTVGISLSRLQACVTEHKLAFMRRFAILLCLVTVLIATEYRANASQSEVVLTSLSRPIYPPMAKQMHVQGDVVVKLAVKRDGTVEMVEVISGPPMLTSASLESARNSTFDCSSCTEALTLSRVVYTFQAVPPEFGANCEVIRDARYPQVTQTQNHVTVIDQVVGPCDPAGTITKFRSAKCLYLWKCGHR